jgi:hypothetical protein
MYRCDAGICQESVREIVRERKCKKPLIDGLKMIQTERMGEGERVTDKGLLADGVRFELTVSLHPRRFSRPLP